MGELTIQYLANMGFDIAENNNSPRMCVAINIPKACSTGLRIRILGFFITSFASTFSVVTAGVSSSIHAALTHSYKPVNIMATLMMTALGKKLPILRKVVGLVMI